MLARKNAENLEKDQEPRLTSRPRSATESRAHEMRDQVRQGFPMEMKPMSRDELARGLELLKSKIQMLKQAQVRIEREAMQLADAIKANQRVYAQ